MTAIVKEIVTAIVIEIVTTIVISLELVIRIVKNILTVAQKIWAAVKKARIVKIV